VLDRLVKTYHMLLSSGKGAFRSPDRSWYKLLSIMPLNSFLFLKGDQRRATLHQALLLPLYCHMCPTILALNPSTLP